MIISLVMIDISNDYIVSLEICDYVNYHDDICEGGGYLLWSQYVECQFDTAKKVAVIVAGFFWMLMLFIMVSTTADDFFSPNVSRIVAHLKISESIAGVTFMAFGNGAPDIFGSIASVLSSPKPKAGLALGELLGAGIFVTSVVTATIILVRPFKIDIFATIRDLIFYLIALGWILFVFLYSHQVYIWEPSGMPLFSLLRLSVGNSLKTLLSSHYYLIRPSLSVPFQMPGMVFLKLTIPLNETSWSKAVAIIQAICAPQWFLFAIQYLTFKPFDGSPGLYAYAFILSAIVIVLLSIFTSMGVKPRYYEETASYVGFIMSISWIYFISSEIVSVVTMFGVISQISHEVLGLTILAWSNSIGDLIADISVVKQGYPRMAISAAIGGPLFNLLIGFGLPFLIAKAKGRTVTIDFNPTYKMLVLFLGISLSTTLIACFVQRFYLRRPHAIVLILIYLLFITMIILTETDVVVWN
ncbi:unnamed protein product [Haemonchus placei]|uniref:Na_Ca_ex domain-containing protein n=1 Tax=Haemonchus placei TaxID=6290 RepID=A0A158QQX0_HAEPC|nr:unnamed protein product [Haemonchus placei]